MTSNTSFRIGGDFWFAAHGTNAVGNQRIALLERIQATGSISQAARDMGISYKTAWDAVEAINNLADTPLVERHAGGRHGGGTRLTPHGMQLIEVHHVVKGQFEGFIDKLGRGIADFEHFYDLMQRLGMKTSARNELAGTVKSVQRGAVNTEVILDIGRGDELVAIITNTSIENLGLRPGVAAYALIKASWVIVTIGDTLRSSARNRLCGTVTAVTDGAVNAEVTLELPGGKHLTAIITRESVKELGLVPGSEASALVKASHVILAVNA